MKPRLFTQPRPGVLRIRSRFGLLRAFGVIPLLVSGIALHQGLGGHGADQMPPAMAVALGLAFGFMGLVLLFGDMEVTIDRAAGRISKTARLFFLQSCRSRSIGPLRRLRISWEYSRSDDGPLHSYRVYVLTLECDPVSSGPAGFEIARSISYEQVRSESEKIGEFLGLPLRDDAQSLMGG